MSGRLDMPLQNTTNVVAAAGVALPMWWPSLASVSEVAAIWVPILGAVWLLVQILRAIASWGAWK